MHPAAARRYATDALFDPLAIVPAVTRPAAAYAHAWPCKSRSERVPSRSSSRCALCARVVEPGARAPAYMCTLSARHYMCALLQCMELVVRHLGHSLGPSHPTAAAAAELQCPASAMQRLPALVSILQALRKQLGAAREALRLVPLHARAAVRQLLRCDDAHSSALCDCGVADSPAPLRVGLSSPVETSASAQRAHALHVLAHSSAHKVAEQPLRWQRISSSGSLHDATAVGGNPVAWEGDLQALPISGAYCVTRPQLAAMQPRASERVTTLTVAPSACRGTSGQCLAGHVTGADTTESRTPSRLAACWHSPRSPDRRPPSTVFIRHGTNLTPVAPFRRSRSASRRRTLSAQSAPRGTLTPCQRSVKRAALGHGGTLRSTHTRQSHDSDAEPQVRWAFALSSTRRHRACCEYCVDAAFNDAA